MRKSKKLYEGVLHDHSPKIRPKLLKASNWPDYFFQDIKGFYFPLEDNTNKTNYQGDKSKSFLRL